MSHHQLNTSYAVGLSQHQLSEKVETPLEAASNRLERAISSLSEAEGRCRAAADKFCGDEPQPADGSQNEPGFGIVGHLNRMSARLEEIAHGIHYQAKRLNDL